MSQSSESHDVVDIDRYRHVASKEKSRAMSASSGSHDVVDIDQFMRPRHQRPPPARQTARRRARRAPEPHSEHCGPPEPRSEHCGPPSASSSASSSAGEWPAPATGDDDKQCSLDSGLSDGSRAPDEPRARRSRRHVAARQEPSLLAMQEFRAQCERALRDQQHQIARVAELCSRLAERPRRTDRRAERRSEASSSSRSDRASSQCKTYKIIMRKLDELNRVYPNRAQVTPRAVPRPAPHSANRSRPRSSSRSVSVVDKTIGTDDIRTKTQHFTLGEVRMQPFRKNYVVAETVVQTDLTDLNAKKSARNQEFQTCACARRVMRLCGCYMRALVACLAAPAHEQA